MRSGALETIATLHLPSESNACTIPPVDVLSALYLFHVRPAAQMQSKAYSVEGFCGFGSGFIRSASPVQSRIPGWRPMPRSNDSDDLTPGSRSANTK